MGFVIGAAVAVGALVAGAAWLRKSKPQVWAKVLDALRAGGD